MLPTVFGEFRVVADPELRFTPSGKAVGNVRLVANSRKQNEAKEWVDDKVVWLNGTIWEQAAENMVESIEKGSLVEVRGRLETREYEHEGTKRQSFDLLIDSITPSLKYATAKVSKVERSSGSAAPTTSAPASAPVEDPWATTSGGAPGPGTNPDEPPF